MRKVDRRYGRAARCCRLFALLGCLLFCGCQRTESAEIGTDVKFVEEQFPKLEDIEEVRYHYDVKGSDREIGLRNIAFSGLIKIGDAFRQKLEREYSWRETERSKKKKPKSILMKKDQKEYHFLYSGEFEQDGKYISHSWVGDWYLDREEGVLYFECEW